MKTETEPKQTAMQRLINYKFQLVKERGNELDAYDILEMVIRKAESLLPEERKVIKEAFHAGEWTIDYDKTEKFTDSKWKPKFNSFEDYYQTKFKQ